jgi:hypothetical protein
MFKLISILDRLLFLLTKWAVQREQVKAQRNRDELQKNPANWFDNHFNGMPTIPSQTDQANQANTSDTKTN